MTFPVISHAFQACAGVKKLEEKPTSNRIDRLDVKAKAKALRGIVQSLAQEHGVELKLRKKGGRRWLAK